MNQMKNTILDYRRRNIKEQLELDVYFCGNTAASDLLHWPVHWFCCDDCRSLQIQSTVSFIREFDLHKHVLEIHRKISNLESYKAAFKYCSKIHCLSSELQNHCGYQLPSSVLHQKSVKYDLFLNDHNAIHFHKLYLMATDGINFDLIANEHLQFCRTKNILKCMKDLSKTQINPHELLMIDAILPLFWIFINYSITRIFW